MTGIAPQLTPREIEVLQALADLAQDKRAAAKHLYIEVGTVDSHLKSIYKKTNIRDKGAVILWAFKNQLIQ